MTDNNEAGENQGKEPPSSERKNLFSPPRAETMECGAAIGRGEMQKFVENFQQSARRWELVVYPALFAFVVLAGYGFFLIYSLTGDMHLIARSIDNNMGANMSSMSQDIKAMSQNIHQLSQRIDTMSMRMDEIASHMETLPPMLNHVGNMDQSIGQLEQSVRIMTVNTDQMRADMGVMNRNVSRPMSFFNNFAPW